MMLGLFEKTAVNASRRIGYRTLKSTRCQANSYSTTQDAPRKLRFRDLLKTPVFKSVLLTMVFGSTVIDFMKKKKEQESLISTYETRFGILHGIIAKLERGETIDLNQELNIANSLTRYKYNTVTDVELDEQLDKFLKMADDKDHVFVPAEEETTRPADKTEPTRRDPKKFL